MLTRRGILAGIAAFAGCTTFGGRDSAGDAATPAAGATVVIDVPGLADGTTIPARDTCEGENRSPATDVAGIPARATAYTLVVADPGTGPEPFVHWLLGDVPVTVLSVPPGVPRTPRVNDIDGAARGTNGAGELDYLGPCPPRGDGSHTYRFLVNAVEGTLGVDAGARRPAVDATLSEHAMAPGATTGTFARP